MDSRQSIGGGLRAEESPDLLRGSFDRHRLTKIREGYGTVIAAENRGVDVSLLLRPPSPLTPSDRSGGSTLVLSVTRSTSDGHDLTLPGGRNQGGRDAGCWYRSARDRSTFHDPAPFHIPFVLYLACGSVGPSAPVERRCPRPPSEKQDWGGGSSGPSQARSSGAHTRRRVPPEPLTPGNRGPRGDRPPAQ